MQAGLPQNPCPLLGIIVNQRKCSEAEGLLMESCFNMGETRICLSAAKKINQTDHTDDTGQSMNN